MVVDHRMQERFDPPPSSLCPARIRVEPPKVPIRPVTGHPAAHSASMRPLFGEDLGTAVLNERANARSTRSRASPPPIPRSRPPNWNRGRDAIILIRQQAPSSVFGVTPAEPAVARCPHTAEHGLRVATGRTHRLMRPHLCPRHRTPWIPVPLQAVDRRGAPPPTPRPPHTLTTSTHASPSAPPVPVVKTSHTRR
jgi:hypothetical protein